MKRRALLASIGAGVTGLAGCSGLVGEETPRQTLTPVELPAEGERTRTGGGVTVDTCTDSESEYRRDHPPLDDLPASAATFAEFDCPDFDWADETVCYQDAALATAEVVLVGGGTVTIDDESGGVVEFVLVNRSEQQLRVRPDAWSIQARDRGGWSTLLSGRPGCTRTLRAGETHWWTVGVDTTTSDARDNVTPVSMGLLPGTYALSMPVRRADARDIACLAPFEVLQRDDETATAR